MKQLGFPMLQQIADFWVSRATQSVADPYQFSINNVQPPNEFALCVDNSVFTNVAAAMALNYYAEVAKILGVNISSIYTEIANNITVPFDPVHQMHIEYDGRSYYDNSTIKQADVSLLAYPLQYQMPHQVQLNDLTHEAELVSINGPAMTHGLFAINWLDLNPELYYTKASESFTLGYQLYVTGPFKAWLECPDPGCKVGSNGNLTIVPACPNFITGAGGFLQALLYGYGGLRYNNGNMVLRPVLPANVTSMNFNRIYYLGNNLKMSYDNKNVNLTLASTSISSAPALTLYWKSSTYILIMGKTIQLPAVGAELKLAKNDKNTIY
eukprot:TRINITY_DN18158_c0_g1_i1.p1 TRINITY_DN18158_c0_g1~~TRINITY_DN18158_c0_g1_i1.p1  ORF type:complete len:325 (-),score=53.81 TRINITY_DN18158_c0_g1_i1:51-1025(-)